MALAPCVHTKSMAVHCLSSAQSERFLVSQSISATLSFSRKPLFCSVLASSRGRNLCSVIASASSSSRKKKKRNLSRNHVNEGDEEEEEDAFELLFRQLEEDLKNDDMSKDDSNDEITEEDIAIFERELEDALGDCDTEMINSVINDTETGNDPEEDDGNDDDDNDRDERSVKLKNWQLKKLAKALKAGRRKISIKNLAAELCLDRALVLELLREPPPDLLMMSLSLPDEPTPTLSSPETKPIETVHEATSMDHAKSGSNAKAPVHAESNAKLPIHVMQQKWYARKRLKKAQVATLEKVYSRSKRPTNEMISSIVYVTNLPRRKVVKWFEDKRAQEGVPDRRVPYQRPVSETS